MTKKLCRKLFWEHENAPMFFADMSTFKPYEYSEEKADVHFEKQNAPDRKSFLSECTASFPLQSRKRKIKPKKNTVAFFERSGALRFCIKLMLFCAKRFLQRVLSNKIVKNLPIRCMGRFFSLYFDRIYQKNKTICQKFHL